LNRTVLGEEGRRDREVIIQLIGKMFQYIEITHSLAFFKFPKNTSVIDN